MRDWFRNYTLYTGMRKSLILLPLHSIRMRGLKSWLWGENPEKFGLHSARMCGLKSARELYLSWCAEVAFCTDVWIEIQTIGQFYFFGRVAFYVDKWIEIYLGYWVCYLLCGCVDWNSGLMLSYKAMALHLVRMCRLKYRRELRFL